MSQAVPIIICLILSATLGLGAVAIFNILPARWLTDYNEEPDAALFKKRANFTRHGVLISAVLAICFVILFFKYGLSIYSLICGAVIWLLCLISLSDIKFTIIPDELVIILAILAIGFIADDLILKTTTIHQNWLSPIFGAVIGGLSVFTLGLIGGLIYKKEQTMGFGDVKLMAVCGLISGFPGIITVLVLTVMISGLFFGVLILLKKLGRGDYKPLGPYIAISLTLFLLFHENIYYFVLLYLSFIGI